jgi:NodT family efflux transporter outer membrane factor (OMF) lipoprotein
MRKALVGLMAGAQLLAAGAATAQSPAAPQSVAAPRSPAGGVEASRAPGADGSGRLVFWQRLGDTTLARLTAEALRANRDVVVAEARVRQARAARTNAALDLAPTITVAGGYTRQRSSSAAFGIAIPERDLFDAGLRADWELDVFGRVRRTLRGHTALAQAAGEDVRDVQRVIAAELASAYFDLRGAQDQLDVARRNAENQRRTLQLTRDRLDAGRGNAFDTERAQAQLSTTLASVPTLESRTAAAGHRIGVLIGRDPTAVAAELAGPCPLPALPDVAPGQVDSLIRSRPDVRAAERRLAAETAFVGAAKADYLPRLSVGGTAGFTSTGLDSLGRSGSGRFAVGPVISWPAFNLGRVKAGVDAARALEAEARARQEQTVLLAREEVETALVAYAKARERLTQLTEAADASGRAAELARIRFEGGVADFLQVLDAERSLLATQDQLAQGRTDAVTALVAVYRALGGGEPPAG